MSMMGLALPVPRVLPHPDGTIASADMMHLLFLYSGISATASPTPAERIYVIPHESRIYVVTD